MNGNRLFFALGKATLAIAAAALFVLAYATPVQAARAADYAAVFDAAYYAEHNPDVKNAYGNDTVKLLNHFLTYGMNEGRQANAEFNVDAYRSRYADLNAAFGNNKKQYYIHYIQFGKNEGRDASGSAPAAQPQNGNQTANAQNTGGGSAPEKASAILNSIGWNLNSAFNWSAGLTYYGHGKPDMPENGSPGTHWFANFGFDNRKGNCYVMAATFYEFAKALGYSPRQMDGLVPSRRGGLTPHSWVEIDMDGQTYVFDPDFTYGTGKNGFKIQYGQSGTWRYQSYSRMAE